MPSHFILQSLVRAKPCKGASAVPDSAVGIFMIRRGEVLVVPRHLFQHVFTAAELTDEIERLQAHAKSHRYTLNGALIIGVCEGDNLSFHSWRVLTKKIEKTDTDVKILARGEKKDRKAPMTTEEMLAHVREFCHENGRLPRPGELHDEAKVGDFVNKLSQQHELYDELAREAVVDESD